MKAAQDLRSADICNMTVVSQSLPGRRLLQFWPTTHWSHLKA